MILECEGRGYCKKVGVRICVQSVSLCCFSAFKRQILDTDQKSITNLFSKNVLSEEATYELSKIKEKQQITNRNDLINHLSINEIDKFNGSTKPQIEE